MKSLKLSNCLKYTIIDEEDFIRVTKYSWYLTDGTIATVINKKQKSLSSFILNIKTNNNILIDHKDKDIFNNQKSNLRIATSSQNNANMRIRCTNTSGYKGVTLDKRTNKWKAQISFKCRKIFLGTFFTKEEAARNYNAAAIKYYGEFAVLNDV